MVSVNRNRSVPVSILTLYDTSIGSVVSVVNMFTLSALSAWIKTASLSDSSITRPRLKEMKVSASERANCFSSFIPFRSSSVSVMTSVLPSPSVVELANPVSVWYSPRLVLKPMLGSL